MINSFQVLVVSYSAVVKHLGPELEQLETDANVIRDDLNQLTNMVPIASFPQLIKMKEGLVFLWCQTLSQSVLFL